MTKTVNSRTAREIKARNKFLSKVRKARAYPHNPSGDDMRRFEELKREARRDFDKMQRKFY